MMKTKIILLSCVILLFCIHGFGQTETTKWWFLLEQDTEKKMNVPLQNMRSTTLKLINQERFEEDHFLLGWTLQEAIEEGKLPIYKNKSVGTPFSQKEIQQALYEVSFDTVILFDIETYEEEMKLVKNENTRFPTSKTIYQLEQGWYFDEQNQQLKNNLTAINIGHWEMANNGFINTETLKADFSIKNKTIDHQLSIEKPSVIWAKMIYIYGDFYDRKLREAIFSKTHLTKNKVVSAHDYNFVLDESHIEMTLQGAVDTLLDFKPDDPNPTINVIKAADWSAEQIFTFRIAQDIYFDSETNTFQTKVLAIAPSIKNFDDNGNFIYYSPLFWVVYDDDFLK